MTKKLVPIDAVLVHPLNVRMVRTGDNISRLANSIKRRGQEYPLKVVPDSKNPAKYLCYDGGYRLEAAKANGMKEVWIEIEEVKDDTELIIRSFNTADKAVSLNPLEEAKAFEILIKKMKDPEKVAEAVGRHWKYVKEKMALLNLVAKAKKLVLSGEMTWLPAYNLAKQPKCIQGKALEIIGREEYPGHDNYDIARALATVLGKKGKKNNAPVPPQPPQTRTDADWVCPKCGIRYHTYCHGDKHSFEREY